MIEESEGLCCVSVRFEDTKGFHRGLSGGRRKYGPHTLAMLIQAGNNRRGSSEPPER